MKGVKWFKTAWPPYAVVFLLLLGWQLAVIIFNIERWILPGPIYIMQVGILNLNTLMLHTSATIRLTLIGFSIGVLIGIGLSWILHLIPWFKKGFYPILVLSQNIPLIALAPLL